MAFNAAARIIFRQGKFCHISPLLRKLHWLRVRERVAFKLCLTVHRALNGTAPPCLAELCSVDSARKRPLRSAITAVNRVMVPNRANTSCFADRSFAVAGPVAWNGLPVNLRVEQQTTTFRKGLKTLLSKNSHGALEMVPDH